MAQMAWIRTKKQPAGACLFTGRRIPSSQQEESRCDAILDDRSLQNRPNRHVLVPHIRLSSISRPATHGAWATRCGGERAHKSGMVWVVEPSTKEPGGTVSKAANMEPDVIIQSRPPPHKTLASIEFTPNYSGPSDSACHQADKEVGTFKLGSKRLLLRQAGLDKGVALAEGRVVSPRNRHERT
ncbi:hypothetical protein TWF569_005500 [Orbilia oligospora]|nr:hypothetical protein TWF102_011386 [Orbilia oligospora]KAF3115702.1 hypothetical protein TWF706_005813 [Orbilia oligospora]KAF3141423.1 hypothetical protein TWF594_005980 [Orbilia oligospora]KAF3156514.1 hypothetical protein TWF569_005500 [Orbilia oligospora]